MNLLILYRSARVTDITVLLQVGIDASSFPRRWSFMFPSLTEGLSRFDLRLHFVAGFVVAVAITGSQRVQMGYWWWWWLLVGRVYLFDQRVLVDHPSHGTHTCECEHRRGFSVEKETRHC
jgi:hypothetical protein